MPDPLTPAQQATYDRLAALLPPALAAQLPAAQKALYDKAPPFVLCNDLFDRYTRLATAYNLSVEDLLTRVLHGQADYLAMLLTPPTK